MPDSFCLFPFACTECVSSGPASWSWCRIPELQSCPGGLSCLHTHTYIQAWWYYTDPYLVIWVSFSQLFQLLRLCVFAPSVFPLHILSVCFLSNLVPVLKSSVVFVYVTLVLHSDLYSIFICCIFLLPCCCSGSFSLQGLTKFRVVSPSPCLIQSSIRWSCMYRTWRKRTLKTR